VPQRRTTSTKENIMRKSICVALLLGTAAIASQAMATELPPKYGDLSRDGRWIYVGGDSGWDPAPHRYVSSNGQWKHDDALEHDSPRPAWLTQADRERQIPRPGGAPHELQMQNGKWGHVDRLSHDGPRPAWLTLADRERQIPRPGGAPHELQRQNGQWVHVDKLPH